MKHISAVIFLGIFFLVGCASLPSLYQSIEDVEDNDAIYVNISKDAIDKTKDVCISIDIISTPHN